MAQKKAEANGKGANEPKKTKSNGSSSETSHEAQSVASSSLSSLAIIGCVVVAIVSFTTGVFTPPALSFQRVYKSQQRQSTKDRTRKLQVGLESSEEHVCTEETLSQFLHDKPVKGLHFVCLHHNGTLDLYREAVASTHQQAQLENDTSWSILKDLLQQSLNLQEEPDKQTWAIFSSNGEKLATGKDDVVDMEELKSKGLLVIMRGGQWLWPGVRIGFRRTIDLSVVPGLPKGRTVEKRNATLETLSLRPLVLSVEGFLSDEECDIIQQIATPKIRYSDVVLKDVDEGRPASDFRTSQSTFLSSSAHSVFPEIDFRTAGLVRLPRSHQETVQVLRYGEEEFYSAHNDYFDKRDYQNDPNTLRLIQNGRRNRLATVFWYLSDVSEGGHTAFPRFNGAPQPRDFNDCSVGLRVKPERGKVIIFYSLTANGDLDPLSLHGACAVKGDNVKWAANKWVWNAPMGYIRD